jgi:hypothetical protein
MAPASIDAPVQRGVVEPALIESLTVQANWIWAASEDATAAPPEELAFRKVWQLDQIPEQEAAVITCDNRYTLYVNGQKVRADDDWTTLDPVVLTPYLREGENVLVVIATNGGDAPNPAGLFFQADFRSGDAAQTLASDASWQVSRTVPEEKQIATWKPSPSTQQSATVVPGDPWEATIRGQVKRQLALGLSGDAFPVRAALLESDPLMKTLGRPNRDQIVTSRPQQLSTLEALHLSNSQALADWFAAGSERLLAQRGDDPRALIDWLFRATLTRAPTASERALVHQALGDEPDVQTLQDVWWALCVTPEFLLIR